MKRIKKPVWLFVFTVITVPAILFIIVSWYQKNFLQLPVYGEEGHVVGSFQMKDQAGQAVTEKDWKDKIVVVDFFFTHCPTICPKMTKNLKRIQQTFINEPQLLIQSFTVDPERDSVGQLADYARQFEVHGDQWRLLTGDKKEIYRLARKSFLVVATDGDGGPNDFIHSEKLVLIDSRQRIRGFYNGTSETETRQLIKDINQLKKERSN